MKTFRIWLDKRGRVKYAPNLFVDVKADSAKIALNILRQVISAGHAEAEELPEKQPEKPAASRAIHRVTRGTIDE